MDSADAYSKISFSGKPKAGRRRSIAVSIPNAVVLRGARRRQPEP
jgi:hypothetical protein